MSSKIKILFPVGSLYPNESGGVSLSVYWLLKGLYRTDKVEITTITTTYGILTGRIPENVWLDTDYGKVIYLRNKYHKLGFPIIKEFLKKIKHCDIVQLSSIFYPPSIFCFFIAKFFNKKIIWSSRGSVDDVEFKKMKFFKLVTLFIIKIFTKNITFHATSNEEVAFIKKRLGNNVNIINITNYIILPEKVHVQKENYLLFIGRFHDKKGIDNLLISLKKSSLFISSNFTLKIAGDYNNDYGRQMLELHKSLDLNNKVVFIGHVEGEEKQKIIAKAYFLFMPSFSENFGIVTAEALSQGTPVVASIYSPWQNLQEYQAGFWVDNTSQTLAKTIDQIIQMPSDVYQKYINNSYQLVKNELDIHNNINKWLQLYSSAHNT